MRNIGKDTRSVTSFNRSTNNLLKQLHKTKGPIVLTVNSRAEVILQEAAACHPILDSLHDLEVWKTGSDSDQAAVGGV